MTGPPDLRAELAETVREWLGIAEDEVDPDTLQHVSNFTDAILDVFATPTTVKPVLSDETREAIRQRVHLRDALADALNEYLSARTPLGDVSVLALGAADVALSVLPVHTEGP